MKVNKLVFRAGEGPHAPPLHLNPQSVTVFIGPNNGGKSASLREVHRFLATGIAQNTIFTEIDYTLLEEDEIATKIDLLWDKSYQSSDSVNIRLGSRGNSHEVSLDSLRRALNVGAGRYSQYVHNIFLRHFLLNLGGENRLGLTSNAKAPNLRELPQTTIAALFKDDPVRDSVSDIIHDAFGRFLVIDPTDMGFLHYAFSDSKPTPELERSFTDEAITFFEGTSRIENASDGTKAFVGIITEVLAGVHDILFMDEPEAFLHPALAQLLGREVTRHIAKKQMFVSTHSPNFLMGCMSVGVPVDIVRLTYKTGAATARLLPSGDLAKMMQDPLLKSVGVINALFYESAVVVEADSDRSFYDEINTRINLYDAGGIRHTTFLNAHNKQEATHIARVLRNVGIPAALVLDIDWIKEDGKVALRYLAAAGVPSGLRPGLIETRRQVRALLCAKGGNYKTDGGVGMLTGAELATANDFFDQLDSYGLFTVRNGELESWLLDLQVSARKDLWLSQMFGAMGSDPSKEGYVYPSGADVWGFVRKVNRWTTDTSRKGMEFVDPAELDN
ncbi:ATP-binding protein [Rhizobium sp. YTUHZ045]|uniref:ATP-dependent nuclease n=1 Tax=Rhizobium sp. YTUHZ045 TaxID=2962888 RepID=UPI003DA7CA78